MKTKRVFLDSNIHFSAAYARDSGLKRLWALPGITPVSSLYALQEAERNLGDGDQRKRLKDLASRLELVPHHPEAPPLPPNLHLHKKDVPILQAAMLARAQVLLTGDITHFGKLFGKTVQGVLVLRPSVFILEQTRGQ